MPYSHMRTSSEALAWLVLILRDFRQRIGIRITWKGGKFIQLRCIYGFILTLYIYVVSHFSTSSISTVTALTYK